MTFNKKYGFAFVLLLLVEILIGVFINDNFIRPFIGDVLVVILIYCLIKTFLKKECVLLPLYIFIFATAVEICQYFDLVTILGLQNNRLARIIIGTTFDINDLVCYFVGFVTLILWQMLYKHITKNAKK